MKKIFILSAILLIFSCTNDDQVDNETTPTDESNENYFPQNLDNNWDYHLTEVGPVTTEFDGNYADDDGEVFNKLVHSETIFGMLDEAKVRKSGSQYFLNGEFEFSDIPEYPEIEFENILFLDENASDGDLISTNTFTIPIDSIDYNQNGVHAVITPVMDLRVDIFQNNTYAQTDLNGGVIYDDVLEYEWKYYFQLRLVFSDTGIFTIADHYLVDETQVGNLIQYWANDIGALRTELDIDFADLEYNTLINVPGGQIDLMPYIQQYINQFEQTSYAQVAELTSYNVY